MSRFLVVLLLLTGALPGAERQYVLGPDDSLVIRALYVPEFPKDPVRIDGRGEINLPLVSRVKAGGMTIPQLEAEITKRLKNYLHDPQVTVSVAEFRSRPVSIFGAVTRPGNVQLHGPKTLWELISDAGGFKNDAGDKIRITRRIEEGEIPLEGAEIDPSGRFYTIEIETADVRGASNPKTNIELMDHDTVSVSTADVVYVVGHVNRAGGFVTSGSMSVLEALALAGGQKEHAKIRKCAILRLRPHTDQRLVIPVNLKNILDGKGEDLALKPQDILFIPHNAWGDFGTGLARTVVAAATSSAIYGSLVYR